MQTISSRGLTFFSLIKLLFVGLLSPFLLLGAGCGIAAYFGSGTVKWNDVNLYGSMGFVFGILNSIIVLCIFSLLLPLLIAPGVWFWTRFKLLDLTIKS